MEVERRRGAGRRRRRRRQPSRRATSRALHARSRRGRRRQRRQRDASRLRRLARRRRRPRRRSHRSAARIRACRRLPRTIGPRRGLGMTPYTLRVGTSHRHGMAPDQEWPRTWDDPRRGGSGGRREIRLRGGRAGPVHGAGGTRGWTGRARCDSDETRSPRFFFRELRRDARAGRKLRTRQRGRPGIERTHGPSGRVRRRSDPTGGPRTKLGHPRGCQPQGGRRVQGTEPPGNAPRPVRHSRRLVTRETCQ